MAGAANTTVENSSGLDAGATNAKVVSPGPGDEHKNEETENFQDAMETDLEGEDNSEDKDNMGSKPEDEMVLEDKFVFVRYTNLKSVPFTKEELMIGADPEIGTKI